MSEFRLNHENRVSFFRFLLTRDIYFLCEASDEFGTPTEHHGATAWLPRGADKQLTSECFLDLIAPWRETLARARPLADHMRHVQIRPAVLLALCAHHRD